MQYTLLPGKIYHTSKKFCVRASVCVRATGQEKEAKHKAVYGLKEWAVNVRALHDGGQTVKSLILIMIMEGRVLMSVPC